jgi:hypothetical protein
VWKSSFALDTMLASHGRTTWRSKFRRYPLWVKISLFGVPGRHGMWAFVVLSLALAIASAVYGFRDSRFFYASPAFLVAALLYWLAIRWVDRNGSWDV